MYAAQAAVDLKCPDVDMKAPELDIDMKSKGIHVEGKESKFKLPKMPDFDVSLPKVKGPDIKFSLPKSEADIALPESVEIKAPGVELEATSLEGSVDIPAIEKEGGKGKFKMPQMKMPKFWNFNIWGQGSKNRRRTELAKSRNLSSKGRH